MADVNYGGSTGYGREFRNRLQGSWGIVDVDDCRLACACCHHSQTKHNFSPETALFAQLAASRAGSVPDLHLVTAVAVTTIPIGLASKTLPAPMLPHWVRWTLWLLSPSIFSCLQQCCQIPGPARACGRKETVH